MSSASILAGRAFIELTTKDTKFQKGLQNAAVQLKAFGDRATEIGKRMTLFWAAVSAPAALAVKVFANFDDQMRLCQAVTQATGKEFELLTEKAKKLGRETSFTASQVAAGMVALGRMGFKPKEIDEAISAVMNLSRVTGTDLAQASDIAANSMRMFGLNASKMNYVVDILSTTANNSAQTLDDLYEALRNAAPAAAMANENIMDVCTNLGILANMGIKGSMAGNALKKAYLQMADPKVRQYLEDTYGIAVTDGNGNLRRMADILTDIARAINGMPSAEKLAFLKDVFDIRGMTGAQGLIANIDQIEEFRKKLEESAGSAEKNAKAMDAGIGGTLRILASQIEGVAIAIGQALVPFLKGVAEAFTPIITRITEFISKNEALIVWIAKVVSKCAMFSLALWGIGKAASGVSQMISLLNNTLVMCNNAISHIQQWIGMASSAFQGGIAAIRDYGAALMLAREAMAANNGVLAAEAFTSIAQAAGIAATATNRYTMAILASSNVEVGKKTLAWLRAIPEHFDNLCRQIYVYIQTTYAAATANGVFGLSCKSLKAAMSGMWTAISSAVVSMVKYIATVGVAAAATAALGGIVKVLTVIVHGLHAALMFLASHPIILAITIALAVIAGTIAAIAKQCSDETEKAKKEAEEAEKAYQRARKRSDENTEKRRQGYVNMEALEKLAEASKTSRLSAEEIETAVALINSLEPFMGKGWAQIDKTTGQIKMATNAMKEYEKAAAKQAVLDAEAELKELKAKEKGIRGQMATYGGWRDTFNLGGMLWDYSVDYNKQYEDQLEANASAQVAAANKLANAKKMQERAIYGQNMKKTDAEKAEEAARRREVALKNFQDAEKAAADYEKKIADSRKSALEREIEQIEEAKKKYKEMLQVMIKYEQQKPKSKQNFKKIAEWQKKLNGADAEANRLKQEARAKESKKATDEMKREKTSFAETQSNIQRRRNEEAAQQKIDSVVKDDPAAGAKILAALLEREQRAARQAALEFERAQKEAAKPDKDGVVRYTDEEKERVRAARQKYEQSEGRVDNYRSQLQKVQDSLKNRSESKSIAGFDARTLMGLFGTKEQSVAERQAKTTEDIERLIREILTTLNSKTGSTRIG